MMKPQDEIRIDTMVQEKCGTIEDRSGSAVARNVASSQKDLMQAKHQAQACLEK